MNKPRGQKPVVFFVMPYMPDAEKKVLIERAIGEAEYRHEDIDTDKEEAE